MFTAAAHLFAEKGFDGVSMREISELSQVSKPTIYYYFGSKEGIYRELLAAGFAYVQDKIREIAEKEISVREKLVELTRMFFAESIKHPDFVRFFFNLLSSAPTDRNLLCDLDKQKVGVQLLVQMIGEGIRKGEFGSGVDPELAAEIFGGVIRHFVLMQLASKEIILNDTLAGKIIDLLFKGLNE
ncbi:MAG: TetR/AcrR family transcriptional regulator [candidate division KSB1 bacterium]|nr:TetR/AcrR family transcriptional regulator [candidate division KSB1 bacterium]